jgi:hypothetical protein
VKHFRITFKHCWDESHFKNEKIKSEMKAIVCNFSKLQCPKPCSDCPKGSRGDFFGKIVITNYGDGNITVEILVHCIDEKASQIEELAQTVVMGLEQVISFEVSESNALLF